MKRLVFVIMIVLSGLATTVVARPLKEQTDFVKWALWRYPVRGPFMTAILRYEDGRIGSEAGMNPVKMCEYDSLTADPQAYADQTMPTMAVQHGRLARRMIIQTQQWIFEDSSRRNEFFRWWNKEYGMASLKQVYLVNEKAFLKYRESYNPMTFSGTGIQDVVDGQRVCVRWTVYRYRVSEPLLLTVMQLSEPNRAMESVNKMFSYDAISKGDALYKDPTMPEGAIRYARVARQIVVRIQNWIFDDSYRRNEFLRWWGAKYLGGGRIARTEPERDKANALYSKELKKVYLEEVLKWNDPAREGIYLSWVVTE